MSQRAVEQAIGKLVTDEGFRDAFFANPELARLAAGLDLSAEECRSLACIPRQALKRFCASLDDRICRLFIRPDDEKPR